MNILKYSKNRERVCKDYNYIVDIINIFANNLFEYNPPDGLDKNQVERALSCGTACLYRCNDKASVNFGRWCCTPAFPATVLDNNGDASKVTTNGTDYSLELEVGKDCILLYNNSCKTSDEIIDKYANLICETDKTIYTIVEWAKLMPIPKVHGDNDIAKYQTVMERSLKGELINVISDNQYLFGTEGAKDDNLLTLTDPEMSDKLHFLSEFREEVIKRLASLFGIPFNTTAKSAQALNAELHGMDMYSMFLLFDRYYARKESFERAAEFTGHNWNFDFSQLMKHQINDILNHDNETNSEVNQHEVEKAVETFEDVKLEVKT